LDTPLAAPLTLHMDTTALSPVDVQSEVPNDVLTIDFDFLLEITSRIAAADELDKVLGRVVDFVSTLVKCDSCFIYILEGKELILRASKNPHPDIIGRLRLHVGQGITGWVAEHREPVTVARHASKDPRFKVFHELPEDSFEAFLSVPVLCRGRLVGVINLQHKQPHHHSKRQIQLISTIGFLVGAEIEMARLEGENSELNEQLETRKVVERAKGILQRELRISEEEAYLSMRKQSRQRRMPMKDIASAIVLSDEVHRGRSPVSNARTA